MRCRTISCETPRSVINRTVTLKCSITLWWPAVIAPEGSLWWHRYGEWTLDVTSGYCLLFAAPLLLAVFPSRHGLAIAALLFAVSMARLGYSAIRLAGRRQAILDYFNAWRTDSTSTFILPK